MLPEFLYVEVLGTATLLLDLAELGLLLYLLLLLLEELLLYLGVALVLLLVLYALF